MLSYKNSEKIIRNYAKEYKKFKIIDLKGIDLLKDNMLSENVVSYIDSENKYTYYYSVQSKIELILDLLDWDCATFLKKEFFDFNINKTWWYSYYSRSTYYRLKKKYMNQFLELFYA